ncbi:MAG: hypothetical protein EAZ35_09115 [Sphingobacteriia bacterium]|nr:MAG: hypothetical protein EAZ41_00870 [Sphingobacteriia bacterium]TAG29913.1 MAG: hypothetical protein EAZ35_09115 [Sphingobacteriia bacterium]
MEKEENFSAQHSLQLIENMINKAQNRMSDNGTLYLLWGWVVLICSSGQYLLMQFFASSKTGYIWLLTIIAGLVQIIYLSKQKKGAVVKTYTDEIINYIWVSFGICMGIATFIMTNLGSWVVLYSFVLLFYGVPTFLSGIAMRFKPLVIGGIICWCLSIISTFIQQKEILLLLSIAVLSAWIIPGYLLRKKFKSAHI